VSVLALVIAVATGGAYAASKLDRNSVASKQVKNGSLTGKDVKDDSLTGKDVDESSLTVPAGPRGATGPQGTQGAQGTTGPAGPLVDTLPSGQTLRGTWGVGGAGTGDSAYGSISFAYPLASAPTMHILAVGGGSTTNCPGLLSQPEARAGHLCLYSAVQSNVNQLQVCDATGNGSCGGTSKFGVALFANPPGAGDYHAWGTWAVTAP
jgi:hypothetical protein